MSEQHGTAEDRSRLIDEITMAQYAVADAREHLMDEDNDGAFWGDIERAEAQISTARAALAEFDTANPELVATIKAAKAAADELARLDFLRRLRADEGLTQAQSDELAALQAKHGKHYHDMTPDEQAAQRARNAAADQAKTDQFWAEWTPDVTAARREKWNAGLAARGIIKGQKTDPAINRAFDQKAFEREMGHTVGELKRAVAKHFPK